MTEAKKVKTYDLNGNENGFLVELKKEGRKTVSYLTVAAPSAFKGYHAHKVRTSNYVCIRGKVKVILYTHENGREEHILESDPPQKLHIPINVPTGIQNDWDEEAWLVNFPDPYYDPELEGEQVDYTQEEVDKIYT